MKYKNNNNDKHIHEDYVPHVSVVVPTYNEEDTIPIKLKNLYEQEYPNMDIIIIDGCSEDKTVPLIKDFMINSYLDISLIEETERGGKASALNKVFKRCSGEIIVITDADAVWGKGTLRKAISNFHDDGIGAVTGRQILMNPNQSLATMVEKSYRNIYEIMRIGESMLDSTPIFHGEISCYRRDLVEEINEDSMADDSELAIKIRKKGFKSIYDPDAVFYEHAPPTLKSRFLQKLRRGQGLVQLFLRERGLLFRRKYDQFGLVVFPAEFFMHVISPFLSYAFLMSLLYSIFMIDKMLLLILVVLTSIFVASSVIMKISIGILILSYLNSQFILLLSLIYQLLGISQHKWGKINEIRELWKKNQIDI